jgi:electron-transferring-flavoprotein dehydrogenase
MKGNLVSVGLVVGLDYQDPRLDPHRQFQRFKAHPAVSPILTGGTLIRYGAKALPEGGYYSIPRLWADGVLLMGDSAGLLNSQRLKGIHLAMKSGMLAAEAIFQGLLKEDFSANQLSHYETLLRQSWIEQELYKVRNFHQSFDHGPWFGLLNGAVQMITGGRGLKDPLSSRPGHERMKPLKAYDGIGADNCQGVKFDGKVTFDKLTDVYYSRTVHEEDQPCHLIIQDLDICYTRCTVEYGNPCQRFCPANVYEMVDAGPERRLQINASNCVHCKTCDIMDPYQIINWVPPEGGGGPDWVKM